jgi:sodium/hydrogen antiporter
MEGTGRDDQLWALVGLVVTLSILLHGLTVTPVMRQIDEQRGIDPDGPPVRREDDDARRDEPASPEAREAA